MISTRQFLHAHSIFLSIFVKAFSCLLPQLPLSHHLVQHLTLPKKWFIWKPGAPTIHDELVGVEAHIVSQLEGPHWVSSAKFHGKVDILGRSIASLHQPHSLHEVRYQKAVNNESWSIFAINSHLLHCLAPGNHGVEGLVRCLRNSYHLQQLHDRHRVEEVKTTKPILPVAGGGNL